MKKIITALGNPILNNQLKKVKEFNIMINDLQYLEAIIEFLEIEKNIDYIILSELLPGNINIRELINEIKRKNEKINIIMILVKENRELENFLHEREIYNIVYNNKVEINDIIKIINNKKTINHKNIKKINYVKNENSINLNNDLFKKGELTKKLKSNKIKFNNKINKRIKIKNNVFCIMGDSGVGKSIFSVCFSNYLKNKKNKILIIDFDILNNSIHSILGVNKYEKSISNKIKNINKSNINIEELIVKVSKNIYLLSGIELLFNKIKKIGEKELLDIIQILKNKYDYIIIDTSSECFFEYNKTLINNCDKAIFLIEANLLEVSKSIKYLEMYEKNWKINNNKIKIIINKYNKNSISEKIISNIFSDYETIGKIKMNSFYNMIINKNNRNIMNKNNYVKEYKKIGDKILEVNFNKNNNLFKKFKNIILSKINIRY